MNQKLIDEIEIELESMSIIVDDVEFLLNEVGDKEANNIHKTALGGLTSQFYNGFENIIKRIHKHSKIDLPKGDDWHIVLLQRINKNTNFEFPFKINEELFDILTNFRRFRHYFFHGYSHNLNWKILSTSVADIRIVFNQIKF